MDKKNAIHPGNMAYVLGAALAGKPTSVNSSGAAPSINWMAFGNGEVVLQLLFHTALQEYSLHMMDYQ